MLHRQRVAHDGHVARHRPHTAHKGRHLFAGLRPAQVHGVDVRLAAVGLRPPDRLGQATAGRVASIGARHDHEVGV